MELTASETDEAATRLAWASFKKHFSEMTEPERTGLRQIVNNLAAELGQPKSDAALFVFMTWMGDAVPYDKTLR